MPPIASTQSVSTACMWRAAGALAGTKPMSHVSHTRSSFGVRLWIMWLRIQRSPVRFRQPKPVGSVTAVFSSPAAHVGCPFTTQTAWCKWMTSTGGTVPFARTRFGLKLVM